MIFQTSPRRLIHDKVIIIKLSVSLVYVWTTPPSRRPPSCTPSTSSASSPSRTLLYELSCEAAHTVHLRISPSLLPYRFVLSVSPSLLAQIMSKTQCNTHLRDRTLGECLGRAACSSYKQRQREWDWGLLKDRSSLHRNHLILLLTMGYILVTKAPLPRPSCSRSRSQLSKTLLS